MPLLYNSHTEKYLEALKIQAKDIAQYVNFKAQLFVPLNIKTEFVSVNKACVKGFYIHIDELKVFKAHLFYTPLKLMWLAENCRPDLAYTALDMSKKAI